MRAGDLSEVFGALADDTRRGLYERLVTSARGFSATELAATSTVSRQAIVKHLQMLERSGLAVATRDGREVLYRAVDGGTAPASAWLMKHAGAWDRRVEALRENVVRAH